MSKAMVSGSIPMNAGPSDSQAEASRKPSRGRARKMLRGAGVGLPAGIVAGILVGVSEAAVVIASARGPVGTTVVIFGAACYGLLGGAVGAGLGVLLQRFSRFRAWSKDAQYAFVSALFVAAVGFALTAFRVRRDVFQEELTWASGAGLGVLAGCAVAALAVAVVLYFGVGGLLRGLAGRIPAPRWGLPVTLLVLGMVAGTVPGFFGSASARGEGAVSGAAHDGAAAKPNVLFVVVDTLRADHLPAYGYDGGRTPALDRFAQDAVRFEKAYANASWTRPSFASLLTGRYASSHGVMGKADALPDEVDTLPEELSESGYQTAGFVTNYNVAPFFNFQQGFDAYTYLEPNFVLGADDASAKLLLVQTLRKVIEKVNAKLGRVEAGGAYQDAERVNEEVVGWLNEETDSETPWFLFVGYMDPHDPYFPHPYNGTGYSRAAHPNPSAEEADRLRALYDGEITYWDQQFGQLISELKSRGLYDDMMIVVTSDHGEEFAEHGGFWHGTTLYDEQLHVPLFVKLPGNAQGGSGIGHWVQSIDVMPTVVRRLGLSLTAQVQGGDLFEGTDRLFAEESHEGNQLESVRRKVGTVGYKLITANEDNPRGLAPIELYDITRDQTEQQNIANAQRERVEELGEALVEVGKMAAEGAVESQSVEISEQEQERLERLGYGEKE